MMKRTLLSTILLCVCVMMSAQIPFGEGKLCVSKMAVNAVRIQYTFGDAVASDLPDWIYVKKDHVENQDISFLVDAQQQPLTVKDKKGASDTYPCFQEDTTQIA